MKLRTILICAALTAACGGCAQRYYSVPWWKGIPTSLLAPSSLEANTWREQHRRAHQPLRAGEEVYLEETPTSAPQPAVDEGV